MNYIIKLTETQKLCLDTITHDVTEWLTNAAKARSLTAQEEIIAALVAHCNANEIAIATGSDAQVAQAFELKVVDTAKNITEAREAADAKSK